MDVINALRDRGLWPGKEHHDDLGIGWHPEAWGRPVKVYDYVNEHGEIVYQLVRFEPKAFYPRRPDGNGGWKWNLDGTRRMLYQLPRVIAAPIVFVTEGERDAETLREWGFVGTTNVFGCNAWRPEYNECLRGKEVIIIPDYDAPGFARGREIGRSLVGIASRVVVLTELTFRDPAHKDITDWFEEGHSELELVSIVERDLPEDSNTAQ
jgi:5S rRNA maturation endonuclease (ribonuclease M5)